MSSAANEMSPLENVRTSYSNIMGLPPEELWCIDFVMALALFAKEPNQDRDTVYGVLVGPSSCGKTAMLRPFMNWPGFSIEYEDQTENALNSGSFSVKSSFLSDANRRVVVCKEMTTIIGSRPEKRHAFFGVLRGAADGQTTKRSGALSKAINTKSRFTFVGGVTDAIWDFQGELKDLGHRSLYMQPWRGRIHDRAFFRWMAYQSSAGDMSKTLYAPLKRVVRSEFDRLREYYTPPDGKSCLSMFKQDWESDRDYNARKYNHEIEEPTGWTKVRFPEVSVGDEFRWHLVWLADILTLARSGSFVETDVNKAGDSIFRTQTQLRDLASFRALCDLRDSINNDDLDFVRRIAQDSLDPTRFAVVRELYESQGTTPDEIAKKTGRSAAKCEQLLKHYENMGLVTTKLKTVTGALGGTLNLRMYALRDDFQKGIESCRYVESDVARNDPLPPEATTGNLLNGSISQDAGKMTPKSSEAT